MRNWHISLWGFGTFYPYLQLNPTSHVWLMGDIEEKLWTYKTLGEDWVFVSWSLHCYN